MSYDEGRRVIHVVRKEMRFEMCGQRVDATTENVCVMARSGTTGAKYSLVAKEDKAPLHRKIC